MPPALDGGRLAVGRIQRARTGLARDFHNLRGTKHPVTAAMVGRKESLLVLEAFKW